MADRYLLESGAPDGYQLEDGSGVLLLEGVAAASSGWLSPLSVAPSRLWAPQSELRAFGVTVAAAVAFTSFGWHTPLSQAAPGPPVKVGSAFVPLDTRQNNTANTQTIDKWLVPLSAAKPVPYPAPQGAVVWIGQPIAGNNVDLSKWQQPLGKAAAQPPVCLGNTFVPFNTAQNNTANTQDISKWLVPLSNAVPIPRGPLGTVAYPWQASQFTQNTATYQGYQQPLSKAAPTPPVRQSPSVSFTIPSAAVVYSATSQPLSTAPPRPPVQYGSTSVPYNTLQVAAVAVYGGAIQALSTAAPRPAVPGPRSVSIAFPLPDDNHVRWHQPLSRAVAVPQAAPVGFTFVPYNTAQLAQVAVYGWWQPASQAPPPRPIIQSELRPFGVQQAAAAAAVYGGAFPPLSRAIDIPRPAPAGATFVPYNTTQVFVVVYGGAFTPLSVAVARPPVWQGGATWAAQPIAGNNVDIGRWLQPLGRAAPLPPVWQGGPSYTFLSTQFTQNTVSWGNYQQPLSAPVARPPVWQGATSVPYNTAQVIFNTIDYSLYQQPLSRAVPIPYTTVTQGWTFVPFNTVQVTPPVTPPVITPEVQNQPAGFVTPVWRPVYENLFKKLERKRRREEEREAELQLELQRAQQAQDAAQARDSVIEAARASARLARITNQIQVVTEQIVETRQAILDLHARIAQEEQDDEEAMIILLLSD